MQKDETPESVLLNEIDVFLEDSSMGPSYFGQQACGISDVVDRLRRGGTVTLRTAAKLRLFIEQHSRAAKRSD